MLRWLADKWDWFIYRMFYRSFNRFFSRNIGASYLLLYQTQAFIAERDPNGELAHSAKVFWDAMQDATKQKGGN